MEELKSKPENMTMFVICEDCKESFKKNDDSKINLCFLCENERREKRQAEIKRIDDMKQILTPKGYNEFTFDNFKSSDDNISIFELCKKLNADKENLYLFGKCGSGKTHLSYAIARECMEERMKVGIFKPPELSRAFRMKNPSEESRLISKLSKLDLLVIDDLGVGKSTEFANQILYEILDERICNYKAGLIINSNLSLPEFAEKCGDDRLPSRIRALCKIAELKGADYRLKRKRG